MRTGAPRDITPLLTYGYQVKIGEYISRGWELLQPKLGIFIGYVAVIFGINLVLGFIPFIGSIVSSVISPVLNAGLFIVAYKHLLGEPVEFGDFFKGFEKVAFLLVALVQGLMILPGFIFLIVGIYLGENFYGFLNLLILLGFIYLIVSGIYVGIAYSFAQLFIIDQDLGFWPAMEMSRQLVTKNFFPMFGFLLLLGLINLGGALLCGFGLLLTIPLTYCAMTVAYMDIMNQGANPINSTSTF
ncbi:hypothetical protein LQF76_10460 [Gloeomargaritales cyanobacterium VI4D9]|nr:hypothetical protein LQF76_10460 [Gloeomargaritales cyanobacterium VI4D9]